MIANPFRIGKRALWDPFGDKGYFLKTIVRGTLQHYRYSVDYQIEIQYEKPADVFGRQTFAAYTCDC